MATGPKRRQVVMIAALSTLSLLPGVGVGCDRDEPPTDPTAAPSTSSGPGGLAPDLAAKVLAKVGDRVITLGDYATVLERMDRFERLRYQTEDRRKQLLEELIDVELLAQEAERRGLDDKPEARELVRQVLRDQLLDEVRAKLPPLDDIPMAEVRRYYEAHRGEFREPARRRIAAIVVKDAKSAASILEKARGADAKTFGELARKHSTEPRPASDGPPPPLELSGDLGFVSAPSHGKNDNPRVPEPVRAAAFEIAKPGAVLDHAVEADGKHYVVRLISENAARDRPLAEAERTIRVALGRQKLREAEAALEADLRKKLPVSIDEDALSRVEVPPVEGSR